MGVNYVTLYLSKTREVDRACSNRRRHTLLGGPRDMHMHMCMHMHMHMHMYMHMHM